MLFTHTHWLSSLTSLAPCKMPTTACLPSSRVGSLLSADWEPCVYLTNVSWLQITVQLCQCVRLKCSLTSLHVAVATSRSTALNLHAETLITNTTTSPVRSGVPNTYTRGVAGIHMHNGDDYITTVGTLIMHPF